MLVKYVDLLSNSDVNGNGAGGDSSKLFPSKDPPAGRSELVGTKHPVFQSKSEDGMSDPEPEALAEIPANFVATRCLRTPRDV